MSNLREVNDDILKDWLDFREDSIASLDCAEDKKHWIYFDEISERILKNVPEQNRKYVQKQLKQLDDNFFDLLPGETKCIRVLPSPSSGVIYAETAYDQTIVSCQWDKEKEK